MKAIRPAAAIGAVRDLAPDPNIKMSALPQECPELILHGSHRAIVFAALVLQARGDYPFATVQIAILLLHERNTRSYDWQTLHRCERLGFAFPSHPLMAYKPVPDSPAAFEIQIQDDLLEFVIQLKDRLNKKESFI